MAPKTLVEENSYYHKGNPIIRNNNNNNNNDNLTVVELFCGCGGTSLGFEMAGFDVLLGTDIHKPSIETFGLNHPNASTILGDIKQMSPDLIKDILKDSKIDVLIGGVPCQGFSLNNKKRDSNDERNFLYKEFLRFAKELQPRVIVIENVSGMISTKSGAFVKDIEKDIKKLGNYTVSSAMLNAADYGVPQRRQRLLFVALKDNETFDFAKVIKTHGESTNKPYVTIKDAIGDLPSIGNNEEKQKYAKNPQCEYQELMRKNSKELTNHKSPKHPEDTINKIKNTKPGEPMYPNFKQRIRLAWDILSPTQVSGGIRPQFQFGHPSDNRGLTIRERCRLQSFPDDFKVSGGIVQGRVQTGNAVPPLLARAVALAIKQYLERGGKDV